MSEAQRWTVKNTLPNSDGGTPFIRPEVVLAADFDRVTAERDALQQRLTAADERADELEKLLRDALPALDLAADAFKSAKPIRNKVRAALKPADGFLGSTCNEVREEAGLPINRPCKACNGSACIDR